MTQQYAFIEGRNLSKLIAALSSIYKVVTPAGENDYIWQNTKEEYSFNKYRAVTSIRQFYIPSQEHLNDYFSPLEYMPQPICILGAKNCDLTSLYIQDYVFLQGEPDARYAQMRERNLIISSDCTAFKDVCFCLALKINPYPDKLFDLNLAPAGSGYLVEIGSDKGKEIVKKNITLFELSEPRHIEERRLQREKMVENLSRYLGTLDLVKDKELYGLVKNNPEHAFWAHEALRCVECGACIMNCPTCHCFLLCDTKQGSDYVRSRIWDGCQYKNFTRVAGGANPLKMRKSRLRNRYVKKFEFFPDNLNMYACTGCGRCIESCPAKIDLREIFKKLKANPEVVKL
ncbi:MAG: 4Fe-4S dicluster domain-containing protein [Candidatus Omnitrophota bacterium]